MPGIKLSIPQSDIIQEIKSAIKGGAKPLYRHDFNPARRFAEGFNINAGAASHVEPGGLYFSEKLQDIPGLCGPKNFVGLDKKASISELKDFLTSGQWSKWRNSVGGKGLGDLVTPNVGFITGVLDPQTKVATFNSNEWLDYLEDTVNKHREKIFGSGSKEGYYLLNSKKLRNYAEQGGTAEHPTKFEQEIPRILSERLLDEGFEAVTFPDIVARQPHLIQTVLLNQGNMIAKWRKGKATGAGILGASLALMNENEDHLQSH